MGQIAGGKKEKYFPKGNKNKKWINYFNNGSSWFYWLSTWSQYKKEPFDLICTVQQIYAKAKKKILLIFTHLWDFFQFVPAGPDPQS